MQEPTRVLDDDATCVLYVGDRAMNILLLEAIFQRRPRLRLIVATTADQALRIADTAQPRLVLLDLELAACHGPGLLRRLRALPGCADVRAVAVTADHHFDNADSGFNEIWGKPLGPGQVLDRLDRLTSAMPPQRTIHAHHVAGRPGHRIEAGLTAR